MSVIKRPINYEELEKELDDALRADELYKLQNDAKFRAIEQAVPTYEDFRAMVDGAHLKSLDRKDMTPNIGVKWNSVANKKSSQCDKGFKIYRPTINQIPSNAMPQNSCEFRRFWKKSIDDGAKFELLKSSRYLMFTFKKGFEAHNHSSLAMRTKIFRSEIPPDILHDCLRVCLETLHKSQEESSSVVDVLTSLSECNRFQLAVAFMSEDEKIVCRKLFESLRDTSRETNEKFDAIAVLENAYLS